LIIIIVSVAAATAVAAAQLAYISDKLLERASVGGRLYALVERI